MVVDTSVLFSLVIEEERSAAAERAVRAHDRPALCAIAPLELNAALGRWVRGGRLSADHARTARNAIAEQIREGLWRIVPFAPAHLAAAADWLAEPDLALGTLDALHVAVAHALGEPLLTADDQQARAAKRLGVRARVV